MKNPSEPSLYNSFFMGSLILLWIVVCTEVTTVSLLLLRRSDTSTSASNAGIFKQSVGARNRVGKVLSHRPARLHRLAKFIPWNRFLGYITV